MDAKRGKASFRGDMAAEQFPKEERVRRRREYLTIQRRGEKVHLEQLLAFVRAGEPQRRRIGITVSKKVGKAVERNRVKRLVREAWRRNKQAFPLGKDVVFVAKRNASESSFTKIEEQLLKLGRRLMRKREVEQ